VGFEVIERVLIIGKKEAGVGVSATTEVRSVLAVV
jgi:hypothetical protein